MRFATFAQTVLAVSSLVSATPIEKREFVTDVDYITNLSVVTTTVGGSVANQTPAPAAPTQNQAAQPQPQQQQQTAQTQQQQPQSLTQKPKHKAVQHTHAAKQKVQQAQPQAQTSIVTVQPAQTQTQTQTQQKQQQPAATQAQTKPQDQNLVQNNDGKKVWAWTRVVPEQPVTKPAQQAKSTPKPTSASSASPSPSPSPSPSSSPSSSSPANTYQKDVLNSHNIHRSNHSASALTWSGDLENSALVLAQGCVYEHNTHINGGGYGQNIGFGVSKENIAQMITNMMYNDEYGFFEPYFGEAKPGGDFEKYGHFTQIVWKETQQVGCATVMCDSLGKSGSNEKLPFSVCNYHPAGNMQGEYAKNVLKPLGHPYQRA